MPITVKVKMVMKLFKPKGKEIKGGFILQSCILAIRNGTFLNLFLSGGVLKLWFYYPIDKP